MIIIASFEVSWFKDTKKMISYIDETAQAAGLVQARMEWFTSQTSDGLGVLTEKFAEVRDLTNGLFSENDLQSAYLDNAILGVEFFNNYLDEMAVLSLKTGQDLSKTTKMVKDAIKSGTIEPLIDLGLITEETFALMGKDFTRSIKDWDELQRNTLIQITLQDFMNNNLEDLGMYLGSASVQIKIFQKRMENVAAIMGKPMQKVNQLFYLGLNQILELLEKSTVGRFLLELAGWAAAFISIANSIKPMIDMFQKLVGVWRLLAPVFSTAFLPFLKFIAIAAVVYLIVEDLIFAFFDLGDSLTEKLFDAAMAFLGFEYTFQDFREDLITGLQAIGNFFVMIWDWIKAAWGEGQGWLAGVVGGIINLVWGMLEWFNGSSLVMLGTLIGIFSGNWSLLEKGVELLVNGLRDMWSGLKDIFAVPLDWISGKIAEWKDNTLAWVDEVIQGFLNIPGTVMEGLAGFGTQLKDQFTGILSDLRNMLPFSPAKEGPLVDLHTAGENIIGNIQEGVDRSQGLSIEHKLAGAAQQAGATEPLAIPALGSTGSITFSPTIQISLDGGTGSNLEEQMRRAKEAAQQEFVPMLEQVFRRLQAKRPLSTES